MSNAVTAGWHGHDYQARFFWIHAAALRNPEQTHVVEVSYEADGPKGFDDVVIRYDPPRHNSSGEFRVAVDYNQIKFHVTLAGRFGYEDLVNPDFIGATKFSLLENLQKAKATAPPNSAFTLVTTDRISDNDPLGAIIATTDHSLRFDKLFDGTGDKSRMGKVRKLWREHLKLSSDADLREVLAGLHIAEGHRSLEQLRDEVNLRFQIAGLITCHESIEFRFDAAARALKAARRYQFSRETFQNLCAEEGWIREDGSEDFLNVAIRSFSDGPTARLDAHPDNSLSIVDLFEERQLRPETDWTEDVLPVVEAFLKAHRRDDKRIRLFLDVHASIAFLAGTAVGLKSGTAVELVQKGRAGISVWRADDGKDGPAASMHLEAVGAGPDVAVVVSLSRDVLDDVREYVAEHLPNVGRLIHATSASGPGQSAVIGGAHAARLADNVEDAVKKARISFGATAHMFVSGPNAFTFFLGQHREAMGPCVLYEYDFSRRVDGSYHPTFRID